MSYTVYILQSLTNSRYYIGQTGNMDDRLRRHNNGLVKSTKHGKPWKIVRVETLETKNQACRRELEIKSYKGGILFKKLLGLWEDNRC